MTGFVEPGDADGRTVGVAGTADAATRSGDRGSAADGDARPLWFTGAPTPETAEEWVDVRLAVQHPDTGLTFVVRGLRRRAGRVVELLNVDAPNRRSRSAIPGTVVGATQSVSTPRPNC